MSGSLKLSVLLVTYNHEDYIKEAIESILMQDLDFDYEIIVADDCSTDNTLEIISQYKKKYPNKIVILDSKENVGITKNYFRGFNACNGEYIAVLEGDDYWTSPQKIKKQINVLDENSCCVLSFNRFVVLDSMTKKYNIQPWPIKEQFQLITVTDLIRSNFIGNFSTCVYRAGVIKKIDKRLFELTVYDWMLNIVVAQYGLIAYVPDVMSVYRQHSSGTWSKMTEIEKLQETINLIDKYNAYLDFNYNVEFLEHKNQLLHKVHLLSNPKPNQLSNKKKVIMKIKDYIPPFILVVIKNIMPPKLLNWIKR